MVGAGVCAATWWALVCAGLHGRGWCVQDYMVGAVVCRTTW